MRLRSARATESLASARRVETHATEDHRKLCRNDAHALRVISRGQPVASLSVTKSLIGEAYTPAAGGDWFARYTAALMLGAAIGGVVLGRFGDRHGRTRGLGASILLYSLGAAAGGSVTSQWELLGLRFLVGLGVGGVWPNGIALVAESWPAAMEFTTAASDVDGASVATPRQRAGAVCRPRICATNLP